MKLRSTVTAAASKNVPSQTLAVNPAENVFAVAKIPFYEGNMMFARDVVDVAVNVKFTILCGKFCLCFHYHVFFVYAAIILKRLNRDEFKVELFCKLEQVVLFHHRAVFFHDFAAKPDFL